MLHTIRGLLIACTAAAVLLSTPAESLACGCGFFKRLFGCGCGHADPCADPCATGRTTYRPLFGWFGRRAACCNPCAPTCAPVCAPQTCYRTECVNVPVTACRPVTTCDPCTGCPTTVMRPYTTYVRQVRRVPYTTYRVAPAPAAGCCSVGHAGYAAPMGGCSACGTTAGYAPAPTGGYSMQPLPGVTHSHAADATTYAPSYPAAPSHSGSIQSGTVIQSGPATSTPAPTLNSEIEVDSTYEGESSPSGATLQRPIPDINVGGSNNRVQPSDAHTGDRTTSMPIHRGGGTWSAQVRPASAVIPAKLVRPSKTTIDDDGWTAARR